MNIKPHQVTTKTGLDLIITQAKFKNVDFLKPLIRGTVVTLGNDDSCTWWLAQTIEGLLIGAVCAKDMGRGKFRMKSDIVTPDYRKQGVYALLCAAREAWCVSQEAVELNCFSSSYSRRQFEKMGYEVSGDPDKANVYMRKIL